MTLFGYKGLVLSPFVYNTIGSGADRFIPSGCGFLQYADYLVVYMAHSLRGSWTGSHCLHIVECFLYFYGPDDICFKVGGFAVY
jgi:hypothetical protein